MSQYTSAHLNSKIHTSTQEIEDFSNYDQDQCKPRKHFSRRRLFPDKYPSFYIRTKEVLSRGFRKLNKTFSNFKNTIGTSTQNLWINNFTRSEIEKYDLVCSTFQTPSRKSRSMLGRTPIKLYSPFGIETPLKFQ